MNILQKKSSYIEEELYFRLPDEIKAILGGPDNLTITTNIIKTAGLSEDFRPYINTVAFGLFIGELNPKFLVQGVKEWLALDDTKTQLVATLIKKTFVDPHQDFLNSLYNPKPTPPVPQSNVVDLKNRQ